MSHRILIYVLRHDLRLADNPVFSAITALNSKQITHLIPLFVFNPIQFETSGLLRDSKQSPYPEARSRLGNFWRCGPHRAQFLAESLFDLKAKLKAVGSDLVIRAGRTDQVVVDVIHRLGCQIHGVWITRDAASEELAEERAIRRALPEGIRLRVFEDESTLIHRQDLPVPVSEISNVFTSFRKPLEPLTSNVRPVLRAPSALPPLPGNIPDGIEMYDIPDDLTSLISALQRPLVAKPDISLPPMPPNAISAHNLRGGERPAHARVTHLLATGAACTYKDTRNSLLGTDCSTKLSAYLAHGCITARQIHAALSAWEDTHNAGRDNAGTAAIRFELLWRDYMRFCLEKYGAAFFDLYGFGAQHDPCTEWRVPDVRRDPAAMDAFVRWQTGRTTTGLIDASQRELLLTGYTSNRARQNVASFLAKHLRIDWRLGAEWYESQLVDYDVASNWGNWAYVAGVGNDPRGAGRVFNPVKQASDYDPRGEYVKAWVEEACDVENVEAVWQLWKLPEEERRRKGIADGLVKIEWGAQRGRGSGGGGAGRGKGNRRPQIGGMRVNGGGV